ncbi:crotonase/enoyl-CoA hydratase family protein [Amnibacterium flavum]|uniref:Enoyl-CoA hydratase n=1 Tax=Amnibacterium flavum TaxID=2173173 RepID=A0A2V1HUG1_9MICO|nr:crotonase/enoyl-CoA hydratase family protein [Amnibacterium flavum]PVZ93937.1 enoyl-CoA hydratase [Amnibacterium flavum]
MSETDVPARIDVRQHGAVRVIGLDRPDKRNAADVRMLRELAQAYGDFERDPDSRVAVIHGVGDHFTGGLDLGDIGPRLSEPGGLELIPDGGIDPWGLIGAARTKPVVMAVQGTCLTLGVELILASEVTVAADSTRFGQIEVSRAILPFGGATIRFPRAVGWGNAMRWMLTGDLFDATEALRIGLVQEVVPHGEQLTRAIEIAARIAEQAPLAVQATLANARLAIADGDEAAAAELNSQLQTLSASEDAAIGMRAFLTRTAPHYVGR